MKSISLKTILVILVVLAAFLAVEIYKKDSPPSAGRSPIQSQTPSVAPGMPADLERVLNAPGPNAPESEKIAHAQLVASTAVETNSIDITGCKVQPAVSRIASSSDLALTNGDPVEHRIVFDPETFITVPAKSQKIVKADFGKGPGIYGFGCDQLPYAVGMMIVE